MILFVGLGNPGEKYARNRHNIGFLAVEAIAEQYGFAAPRKRFGGLLQEGRVGGEKLLLFRPLSFMNLSGTPVASVKGFFRLPVENIIVFHDELDLAAGKLRVKTGGGTAGHNGLRSLVDAIGGGFRRVRLGIGRPHRQGDDKVLSHVLGDFSRDDENWLAPLLESIALSTPLLLEGRDDAFASKAHLRFSKALAQSESDNGI